MSEQLHFPLFADVTMAIEAVDGGHKITFTNGDTILFNETRQTPPWESAQIQAELGNKLYRHLPETKQEQYKQDWVKEQVIKALQALKQAIEENEETRRKLESPALQKVLDATDRVDIWPGETTRYVVTLRGHKLEFTPNQINGGPVVLKNAWLNTFPTDRLDITSEDWRRITDEWLSNATVHDREETTETDILVTKLLGEIKRRVVVHADREALLEKHNAWYDGENIWIRSEDIADLLDRLKRRDIELSKISTELQDRGITRGTSKRKRAGGSRVSVWPFDPEALDFDPGSVIENTCDEVSL